MIQGQGGEKLSNVFLQSSLFSKPKYNNKLKKAKTPKRYNLFFLLKKANSQDKVIYFLSV